MFRSLFLIAFVISSSEAFFVSKPAFTTTTKLSSSAGSPFGSDFIMDEVQRTTLERAHECVQNFGTFTVEEVEDIKSNLPKGENYVAAIPDATDLQYHLLEDELEKQLFYLNLENAPDSALFPEE